MKAVPVVFFIVECQDALGMESGAIADSQLSASSQWDAYHSVQQGRLNFREVIGQLSGAWAAGVNNADQWLQIDVLGFRKRYTRITRVATQGRDSSSSVQRVTTYKLQYSNDGVNFQYYKERGQPTDKVKSYKPSEGKFKFFTLCSHTPYFSLYEKLNQNDTL